MMTTHVMLCAREGAMPQCVHRMGAWLSSNVVDLKAWICKSICAPLYRHQRHVVVADACTLLPYNLIR